MFTVIPSPLPLTAFPLTPLHFITFHLAAQTTYPSTYPFHWPTLRQTSLFMPRLPSSLSAWDLTFIAAILIGSRFFLLFFPYLLTYWRVDLLLFFTPLHSASLLLPCSFPLITPSFPFTFSASPCLGLFTVPFLKFSLTR